MISIITPVYKGSQYFAALENMISQNVKILHSKYPDVLVEFIIVNDYPQENISIEIFKRTAEYQAFLISPKKNGGVHSARVLGLKQARGKYILFLDQDDEIYTNFLLKQYELALHNKDADVIVCNAIKEMNGKGVLWYPSQIRLSFVTKPWIYLMVKNQIISPGHCLIKKESIPQDWYEHIVAQTGADDLMLWLLMFNERKKFIASKEVLYCHKETGNNVSSDYKKMELSFYDTKKKLEETGKITDKQMHMFCRYHMFKFTYHKLSGLKKVYCCFRNLDLIMAYLMYRASAYIFPFKLIEKDPS